MVAMSKANPVSACDLWNGGASRCRSIRPAARAIRVADTPWLELIMFIPIKENK